MFLRYITSPRNLAQLLTMCRQHQQCQNSSVLEALRAMGVTHYKCFTETSLESGLPHTHWICWTSGGPSVLLNRLQKGDSSLTSMDLEPVVALLKVTITVSLSVEALQEQFPHLSQQVAQDVMTQAWPGHSPACDPPSGWQGAPEKEDTCRGKLGPQWRSKGHHNAEG